MAFSRFWDRNRAYTAAEGHRNDRYIRSCASGMLKKRRSALTLSANDIRNENSRSTRRPPEAGADKMHAGDRWQCCLMEWFFCAVPR